MPRVGALLFRVPPQEEGRFVPASVALRVATTPPVARVPGGPDGLAGVALYEGGIVPVLALGPSRGEMIVCDCDGELVAIVGGEAFETGTFDLEVGPPAFIEHRGLRFGALDVPALCAQAARRGPWAG